MNRKRIALLISLLLFLLSPAYTHISKKGKDNAGPTVTLAMPAPTGNNGWYNEQIFISVQAFDPSGIKSKRISLGGATWYDTALTVRTDGTFMVIGRATDKKGNTSSVRQLIHVDLTAPEVNFMVPEADGNQDWFLDQLHISLSGEDNLSGVYQTNLIAHSTFDASERNPLDLREMYLPVEMQENNQSVVLGKTIDEKRASIDLEDSGSYIVRGYVEDMAGNRTNVESEILLDDIAPQVSYQIPTKYSGEIELSGSLSDHDSGIYWMMLNKGDEWQLVDFDQQGWNVLWDTDGLKDGDYEIRAMVADKAGNRTEISYPVTIVNNVWVIFALSGFLFSLGFIAMYDPRRKAIQEMTVTLSRFARMDYNARHIRKEV